MRNFKIPLSEKIFSEKLFNRKQLYFFHHVHISEKFLNSNWHLSRRRKKMMETNELIMYYLALKVINRTQNNASKRKKRFWVRSILKEREKAGAFKCLVQKMRFTDRESYFRYILSNIEKFRIFSDKQNLLLCLLYLPTYSWNHIYRYLRMSPERFDHLISSVGPHITREDTNFRKPIAANKRLAITLRFLASMES